MQIDLRKPEFIMKLDRLGSFHQSKLSFLRSFIREFQDWKFKTHEIVLDEKLEILRKNKKNGSLEEIFNKLTR